MAGKTTPGGNYGVVLQPCRREGDRRDLLRTPRRPKGHHVSGQQCCGHVRSLNGPGILKDLNSG